MIATLLVMSGFATASQLSADTCAMHHKNIDCLPAQKTTSSCEPDLCMAKPTAMTFVYTGGNCKHSFNNQLNTHFFCADHIEGGAPSAIGTKSFVKAIDTTGGGNTTYYSDWVHVGEAFTLFNNGHDFDDSLVMTIHDSEMNLLQEIIYQTTCDGNLFLCDRFGSVELCGLINDAQGVMDSCPSTAKQ